MQDGWRAECRGACVYREGSHADYGRNAYVSGYDDCFRQGYQGSYGRHYRYGSCVNGDSLIL